jgi:predicted short-subunit dehydrogenase-like oxidoreductase (DUF2520 family)
VNVCYPPLVAKKRPSHPSISIVGPGNLGSALALELARNGYAVRQIASRNGGKTTSSKVLARRVKAEHVFLGDCPLDSDIIWLTVPDDAIADVARQLALTQPWKDKIVLHSSGALTSEELAPLSKKGALVASVHPMMSFVPERKPAWQDVAFAIEGDNKAASMASQIARHLGGNPFKIARKNKALYHAFGAFASPLVIALMSSMEQVAEAAAIPRSQTKRIVLPLLRQTWGNYLQRDAAAAFSGPLARGDVQTINRHLAQLKRAPEAREVYLALARTAIKRLPVKNKEALAEVLGVTKRPTTP